MSHEIVLVNDSSPDDTFEVIRELCARRKDICGINLARNFGQHSGFSAMMAALVFIGGMIMLMLGLIGEYIGRIYISLNNSPQYVIKECIGEKHRGEELPGTEHELPI